MEMAVMTMPNPRHYGDTRNW
ncbi:hypothetical protein I315_06146 [Cryptococcus gattii Ru294]|uniref:Uncharacterized protein n=2 Tax=Cryptococcus gattii TaxID=37769 RepID=E6RBA3_CRYGW|nr:Hypothetical Protein CGB_H5030W [Cryptococcus gattii WM276]KIR51447.1 hypothetical protein I315_06146 [Cryptococcus gattii Ru294]KIR81265.1 hypothetical protein I306_01679 [Cryptococcus gattii EJB2]KIY34870.1 hypothetical protein I305_02430 [Cryptococcus gattii E566]KJE01060.1 hypothetical protein I311_05334 [Cryptococcus gattii NT-10]ADV24103.1 Hypothetical Protein CGB_H5030W [Cryptococcus gattii WM276]